MGIVDLKVQTPKMRPVSRRVERIVRVLDTGAEEPKQTLHGAHCYEKGILVCGWPEEHTL